mgnify:CR=1 FL=1
MPEAQAAAPQVPPEILAYLRGPTEESLHFDFLIGEWQVEGRRYGPGGEQPYTGVWRAQYLHGKRMVMDDFVVHGPSGQEVSAFVTLRTFSPITGRWEMAGMPALQPAVNGKWFGNLVAGEMHLEAEGPGPQGQIVKSRIRFHDIAQGSFQWENRMSFDGGENWVTVATLVASRVQ